MHGGVTLCVLISWLRIPVEQQHWVLIAVVTAVLPTLQPVQSCSSPAYWLPVHIPASSRHHATVNTAYLLECCKACCESGGGNMQSWRRQHPHRQRGHEQYQQETPTCHQCLVDHATIEICLFTECRNSSETFQHRDKHKIPPSVRSLTLSQKPLKKAPNLSLRSGKQLNICCLPVRSQNCCLPEAKTSEQEAKLFITRLHHTHL